MKYLVKILIILLVILFSMKLIIHIFDHGHEVNYSVGNFEVSETLKTGSLYDEDDYYFKINHEKFKINFQLPVSYNKAEKIINTIYYKKVNGMNCIMPIFKGGKVLTDIMCLKTNNITYYHDLSDKDKASLSGMVKSLKRYDYSPKNYTDEAEGHKLSNTQTVYDDNLVENHYMAIENYKGLSLFNSKETAVKLFDNDIYTKPVKYFTDKYYIVADYNEEYSFKYFYVVNLINGKVQKIRSYDDISFDSIMEGSVGDDIYLFDTDAEKQYKISLQYESVEQSSTNNEIKYYDGKWHTMTLNEAINGKIFDKYKAKVPTGYTKADCLGKKTGYCYYYKKVNNNYEVYRSDVQNKKLMTYLFTTSDMKSVTYLNDYIYFINGDSIYYSHNNGVRKVITDTELEFNKDILFGVYIR